MSRQAVEATQGTERDAARACEQCGELLRQVRELREVRDRALADLARAREEVNALRMLRAHREYVPAPGEDVPLPLRYVVADRINDELKRYLRPLHSGTRRVAGTLVQLARRSGWGREG